MPATPVRVAKSVTRAEAVTAANPLREAEQEGAAVEDGFGNKFIRARLAERMAISAKTRPSPARAG